MYPYKKKGKEELKTSTKRSQRIGNWTHKKKDEKKGEKKVLTKLR